MKRHYKWGLIVTPVFFVVLSMIVVLGGSRVWPRPTPIAAAVPLVVHPTAQTTSSIPLILGGNLSTLGNGTYNPAGIPGGLQNFWLSVKAPYTQVANGDAYSSIVGIPLEVGAPDYTLGYYQCVRNNPVNNPPTHRPLNNQGCNQDSAQVLQNELNPLHPGFAGYNYAIVVSGTDRVDVNLDDPGYVNGDNAGDDSACSQNTPTPGDPANIAACKDFYTVYTLKDPQGNLVTGCSAGPHDTGNPRLVYGGNSSATEPWNVGTNPPSVFAWCKTTANNPGQYILNVRTAMPDELGFSDLPAYPASLGTSRPTGANDFGIVTIPESPSTTSQVSALTRMVSKAVISGGGATAYDFAYIPESAVSDTLQLKLYDLGDISLPASINIVDPQGNTIYNTITTDSNRSAYYDGMWLRINYQIPANYSCKAQPSGPPDCWFKLVYHSPSSSGDTTTWESVLTVPPVASFTYSPAVIKLNQPMIFTDTTTGNPTSWLWDFGDGTTSLSENVTHTFTNTGTYTVTLTASNVAGSSTSTRIIFVPSLIVTDTVDNGLGDTAGTLSFALKQAQPGQNIFFALISGNTISVTGALPPVPAGVVIDGSCNGGAPGIIIDGSGAPAGTDGLLLKGNDTLSGIRISGFTGRELVATGSGSRVSCDVVVR